MADQSLLSAWIDRETETEVTAAQIKRMEPGTRITVIHPDRRGRCVRAETTLVYSGKKKVLRWRDAHGDAGTLPVIDYPNKRYTVRRTTE